MMPSAVLVQTTSVDRNPESDVLLHSRICAFLNDEDVDVTALKKPENAT